MIIVLDSTPLGLFLQRRDYRKSSACHAWMQAHLAAQDRIIVPEIIHYEIRRELLRESKGAALTRLDEFLSVEGGNIRSASFQRNASRG